jgi:hypothetical protein
MNATRTIGKRLVIVLGTVLFVGAVGTFVPGDTFAHGMTFTSNNLELKIDDKAWYNGSPVPSATWSLKNLVPGTDKFFNFSDVKPGDFGCNVISIHAQKADAWACIDFKNLKNLDNGVNEPESAVDPNGNASGELAAGTEMFGWIDNGDGKYDPKNEKAIFGNGSTQDAAHLLNDTSYAIGDSKFGGACKQNGAKYVGICWCAGHLSVNPSNGKMTCDGGALGNAAQTDSFSVDVAIRAMPSSQDAKFTCSTPADAGRKDIGHGDDGKGGKRGRDEGWHESRDDFRWPFSFNWNPFNGHRS